ncbi:TIGR04282 family arsenosugar biosynthesis glycosyltransferase [Nitrospira moscoviensis]|uniref:Glycosyltransferase n=1 Tax=Nitrospira moscoviensis TaxID=42253 RepID=A0A0K2GIN6_NITMO|nr:TIGR04282 family arsenosugar biosynthesis glycosyltransferase [Nitrospira moscoviensis]ALA60467.1 hypothetical protein NITMOv2_4084 [Nitrospira moscoviensis]
MTSPRPSPRTPHRSALIIFAKAPIPGQVKTRLCPPLTPDEAATLHGSFVLDTVERSKAAIAKFKLPLDRYLSCAPSSAHVFFKILEERHGVTLIDQIGEDIGMRMHHSFDNLLSKGYQLVLLIGTDVPSLPLEHYQQALAVLGSHDLVLAPALDGGYFLIGLKRPAPELFTGIPWSTDRVLSRTQEKAAALGLKTALLPPWRDVDTIEDIQALIEASAADAARPKKDHVFSSRTSGALQLIAKRLKTRTS